MADNQSLTVAPSIAPAFRTVTLAQESGCGKTLTPSGIFSIGILFAPVSKSSFLRQHLSRSSL